MGSGQGINPINGGQEMRVSRAKQLLEMGGSIVSYINMLGIAVGLIVAGTVYFKDSTANDQTQAQTARDQAAQLIELGKKVEASATDTRKLISDQIAGVDTKLSGQLAEAKTQLQITATQVQNIQTVNVATSGRIDLLDQKMTQTNSQLDRIEAQQPPLEKRVSELENAMAVLKALFEQPTKKR